MSGGKMPGIRLNNERKTEIPFEYRHLPPAIANDTANIL